MAQFSGMSAHRTGTVHHRLTIALAGASAVMLSGCNPSSGPGPAADRTTPDVSHGTGLPDTLEIPAGTERTLDGGRIAVRFLARLSEERCPANVMCVWQGDASVHLRIRVGTKVSETVLHTGVDPRSHIFDGYVFTIAGLFPYPGTYPADAPAPSPSVLLAVARR